MNTVRSAQKGYTIVETMIFLAVSGALFFSAMLVVNGQQRKTEFATAVRDFDSKLQSVISNVSSGYYNNAGTIRCDDTGTGGSPNPRTGVSVQGQNSDCTFIGQYVELVEPARDSFTVTSYAGLRLNSTGAEVQSLAEAVPTPISDTTETYELLDGTTALMVTANPKSPLDTLGFVTTFAQGAGTDGLVSGSARVDMIARDGGPTGAVVATNPENGVMICVAEGDQPGNQVGVILINNGSTTVTLLTIRSGPTDNPCVI